MNKDLAPSGKLKIGLFALSVSLSWNVQAQDAPSAGASASSTAEAERVIRHLAEVVFEETEGNQMTLEEASKQTWTYRQALEEFQGWHVEQRQQAPVWEQLQRDDFRGYLRFLGRQGGRGRYRRGGGGGKDGAGKLQSVVGCHSPPVRGCRPGRPAAGLSAVIMPESSPAARAAGGGPPPPGNGYSRMSTYGTSEIEDETI